MCAAENTGFNDKEHLGRQGYRQEAHCVDQVERGGPCCTKRAGYAVGQDGTSEARQQAHLQGTTGPRTDTGTKTCNSTPYAHKDNKQTPFAKNSEWNNIVSANSGVLLLAKVPERQ
eukprot:CAMPEP_0196654064 /NCGR_PEP_ID=MMETSP1086-20130531/3739_1 /TAXON_ID=77921 /ORGANISM="Cyanoptyche  gloeocystis , Strain SAG4.97" /LENGTH=115 /DNA_ID=CAMNT_0041985599 /DNA_START=266 /DNA_END=613 /DNA_ORIENTATION=+